MVGLIRARRFHEGGGTVWNTWKGAGAEKRGGETRVQKGGQIGLKGGCLKKGRLEPYYKLCITEHTCWSLACNLLVIKSFTRGIIACLNKYWCVWAGESVIAWHSMKGLDIERHLQNQAETNLDCKVFVNKSESSVCYLVRVLGN